MTKEQMEANVRSGQNFKDARLAAGMSQEGVSFEADLDQSTISAVERHGPQEMGWKKLFALSEALGCVIEVKLIPISD